MNEFPIVLVINCGSPSIKFSVLDAANCEVLVAGIADGINSENAFVAINGGEPARLAHYSYEDTLKTIAIELEKRNLMDGVALIDHRIAHGGNIFTKSAIITDKVIGSIRRVSPLAPLHNYANLSGIESAQHLFPSMQQVAVFDTSFHQTMAPGAYLYGLSWKYFEELGARHYGFHGTSHRYVSRRAHKLLGLQSNDSGLVVAHLGNDASICAVRNGQGVGTSVGMTPLEGLMMGTRSGNVDFSTMAWIASETNQALSDLERVVNKESGLPGVSGLSSGLHTLERAWHEGRERTQLATKTFVHRTLRHVARHAAPLHRLDGIIFTGGIDENSVLIRCLVIEHLAVLGVNINNEMNSLPNSHGKRIISSKDARVICAIVPTNEEKMIVRDAIALGKINTPVEFA